jgi:hypothetical protein
VDANLSRNIRSSARAGFPSVVTWAARNLPPPTPPVDLHERVAHGTIKRRAL